MSSACEQVCQSPTNNSKSKMLYSFSKSQRFPKPRAILCDKFYNPTSQQTKRTTSFGYGNKYDFTKDVSNFPPPTSYNIHSNFEEGIKKGFGFGSSRDDMEVTGPFIQMKKNKNPGPGTYRQPSTLNKLFFSLTGKKVEKGKGKSKTPGPGSYPVTFCMNENGNYFLSKHKNTRTYNFGQGSRRNLTRDNKIPGPGTYNPLSVQFSADGKYVLSRMTSSLARKFGTSLRTKIGRKTETPGPGNYRLPSEFGYYQAKTLAQGKENTDFNENQ